MRAYRGPRLVLSRTVEIVRRIRAGGCTAHLHQLHFQGFNNDGTAGNDDATSLAAIDTNFSIDVDTPFGLRFEIEESANCSSMNNQFHLQHNINGAGFVTTSPSTSGVRLVNVGGVTDGQATSNRMAGSSLGFVAGEYDEDGIAANITLQNQHAEMHFMVELVGADLTDADPTTFRVITGAATLTEYHVTPTVTAIKGAVDFPLNAEPGAYSATGAAATLLRGLLLAATAGSYALTGAAATTLHGRAANAEAGAYSLTGAPATTVYSSPNVVLAADPGGYTLSGAAVTTLYGRVEQALAATYALTGAAATLLYGRVLEATATTYTLTGFAATLTYTAGGQSSPPPPFIGLTIGIRL